MAKQVVGEIRMFAGSTAPAGWRMCDGSTLNIGDYGDLYALIDTTYGGDGASTFALPDLRGKLPVGQGAGPSLSRRVLGQTFGVKDFTLTADNLPAHSHAINASNNTADAATPGPALTLGVISQDPAVSLFYGRGAVKKSFSGTALSYDGGNAAHTNQMRTLSINYIIAVEGNFPPRG